MKRVTYALLVFAPVLALAQAPLTIVPFLANVNNLILNPIIALLFGISFVYFAYGVVKFLQLDAADKSRDEARSAILWGLVGMVIMFSVYGIIYFVLASFGLSKTDIGLSGGSSGAQQFLKLNSQ